MKKILIFAIVLVAALSITAIVFATANSQTEGKVMNAEKQLLGNGDMEAGTAEWNQYQATRSSQSGAAEEGKLIMRVAYDGSHTFGCMYQGVTTVGNRYRISGWARGDGTSTPVVASKYVQSGQFGTQYWQGTTSTEWQHFDFVFVKQGNPNMQLGSADLEAGSYVEFDDVLLTDYTGEVTNAEKQILADGDMEKSGTTDWTEIQSPTLTKESGAASDGKQILKIAYSGTPHPKVAQTILTVGKMYRASGVARSDGTSAFPRLADDVSTVWDGTNSTDWQTFDVVFVAAGTQLRLISANADGGSEYTEWDDIVITEYTPETTSAQKQLVTDGDMEASNTSAWTSYLSAVLSKESGGAEDGSRVLRVTYGGTGSPNAQQDIGLVGGKRYRVTGWARGDGVSTSPVFRNSPTNWFTGTSSNSWQRIDVVFLAAGTSNNIALLASGTGYAEFDDITVTEL